MKKKGIKNKRGAEFTITTLVIIVLAILVLAVLALGFGMGWNNLWDRISNIFSTGSNVDIVKDGCAYACTSQAQFAWCEQLRTITKPDKSKVQTTCRDWAEKNVAGINPTKIDDCPELTPKCKIPSNTQTPAQSQGAITNGQQTRNTV